MNNIHNNWRKFLAEGSYNETKLLYEVTEEEIEYIQTAVDEMGPEDLAFNELFKGAERVVIPFAAMDLKTELGMYLAIMTTADSNNIELDKLNAGIWFAEQFGKKLKAKKILVQKSGYFVRSAKANKKDLDLIFQLADYAVSSAIKGVSGVVGWDEDNNNKLSCINFNRIKGGKPFDTSLGWYKKMIQEIKTT